MKTDTISISNEKLNTFVLCAKHYLMDAPDSELKTAAEDVLEPAIKKLKKFERGLELLRLKYCKKTATKHIDRDRNKEYQYTEDDYKNLLGAIDDLSELMVKIPTSIVDLDGVPQDGLSSDILRAFEGIIIPKKTRKFENFKDEEEEEEEEEEIDKE